MAGMKFTADIDIKNIIKLRQEIDKLKKSLIEIASVPNSDAAVKALEKQLSTALKKLEEYNLKVYPSFQLNNVLIYSFNSNFQVKHAISAAKFL